MLLSMLILVYPSGSPPIHSTYASTFFRPITLRTRMMISRSHRSGIGRLQVRYNPINPPSIEFPLRKNAVSLDQIHNYNINLEPGYQRGAHHPILPFSFLRHLINQQTLYNLKRNKSASSTRFSATFHNSTHRCVVPPNAWPPRCLTHHQRSTCSRMGQRQKLVLMGSSG